MDFVHAYILPYGNFILFVLILYKVAKKPLSQMAYEKKAQYEDALAKAKKYEQEAQVLREQIAKELATLKSDLEKIRMDAENEARMEIANSLQKAKEMAEQIIEDGKQVAQGLVLEAKQELAGKIIMEVKKLVVAQLKTSLNSQEQKKLTQTKIALLQKL